MDFKDTWTSKKKYYKQSLENTRVALRRAIVNLDMQCTKAEGNCYILKSRSIIDIFSAVVKLKLDCSGLSDGRTEVRIAVRKDGMNIFHKPDKIIDRIFLYIDKYFAPDKKKEQE